MATINMFRGFLVAGAVLAAVIAAAYQQWAAVVILSLGIAAHAALWVRLHRDRQAAEGGTPDGVVPPVQPPASSAP